ncbi:unnamed protein product [Ambrosiozyma monospora]|uniref:Unnamed protein product n=1 Tax=Ambrosiozyma monospora TaxID=43982 RepID=A0ACB5U931_AMBMO|nr:unnamed protein product [Ambrosiozyma monospora]
MYVVNSADVVEKEKAKEEYEKNHTEFKDDKGSDVDVQPREDSFNDESNIGCEDAGNNIQAISVQARHKLVVTFRYSVSDAVKQRKITSRQTNGQDSHEEPVITKIKDDEEYDFGDHDDDRADFISQKVDRHGFIPPNAEECSKISKLMHFLQSEYKQFPNSDLSSEFQQDLDELMYCTNRLYNAVHDIEITEKEAAID